MLRALNGCHLRHIASFGWARPARPAGWRPTLPGTLKRSGVVILTAGAGFSIAALLSVALPGSVLSPPPARGLELRGSTYFVKPPWKVRLVSYATDTWERWAEYFFTIDLSPDAGASLGALTIQQIRGADSRFPFAVENTRAFVGFPRREGPPVPLRARFDADARLFQIDFLEPVPPGTSLTVVLRPWANPSAADTYLFQVVAFPAGPNPVAAPVGVGTLRIYDPSPW